MQKYLKPIRVVLALLFLIALLISFSDIKANLPSNIHKGVLYLQFVPSILKMLTPGTILSIGFIFVLGLTIIGGRIYCSTICPLGVMQDAVIFLRRKTSVKNRYRFKKALNILRYSIFGITLLSFLFSGILFLNVLDPYAIFGRISSHMYQPILLVLNNSIAKILPTIGLVAFESRPVHWASLLFASGMLLLVVTLSAFKGRLYCNSICPVGTFLGMLSKIAFFKIRINESSCTKCGKCQTVCKANCIDIKTLEIDESRCINCYNCLPVCDDKAIGYSRVKNLNQSDVTEHSDARRRFFITASVAYLASKVIPLSAQNGRHNHGANSKRERVCYFTKGPTTPPGSLGIAHLKDRCVACHLCVSVCPTKVLQPSFLEYGITGMNLPKMDYGLSFCNYECTKCSEICPTGAIIEIPLEEKKLVQIGKVVLRRKYCIVESEGTACGSCSEHCPTQAVKMVPYPNGLPGPEIDETICIGCGACEYACPVTEPHPAIFVAPNEVHLLAEKPQSEKVEFEDTEEFPF